MRRRSASRGPRRFCETISIPVAARNEECHHVRRLVYPRETAIACAAKARRRTWTMELRAPRDRELLRRNERGSERLPTLGLEGLPIERQRDGMFQRSEAKGRAH